LRGSGPDAANTQADNSRDEKDIHKYLYFPPSTIFSILLIVLYGGWILINNLEISKEQILGLLYNPKRVSFQEDKATIHVSDQILCSHFSNIFGSWAPF